MSKEKSNKAEAKKEVSKIADSPLKIVGKTNGAKKPEGLKQAPKHSYYRG